MRVPVSITLGTVKVEGAGCEEPVERLWIRNLN